METKQRPTWWNALHDRALAVLTTEWQRVQELRDGGDLSVRTLEDLVVAGVAEMQKLPNVINGIRFGVHTSFRRKAA